MRQVTTGCSIFFRSKAYRYGDLVNTWQRFVIQQEKTVTVNGRPVLLGDHTLVAKDGRRMPGVVSLHDSSETQSKPRYFRGHCWGGIGLVVGTLSACFCCPLQLQIHQGWRHLGLTENTGAQRRAGMAERVVLMALAFALLSDSPCYVVLDAFFSVNTVFQWSYYYSVKHKQPWLHILVRAKDHYVGYFPAPPKPASRPGPQGLYGEKVYLKECFDHPHLFEAVTCRVYGKTETIQVMRLTLIWKPIKDYVLFVFAVTSKGPIILMSSDRELSAIQAIELYCVRTRIETLFSVLKNLVSAFAYRFWTRSLPKHSRRPFPNSQLQAPHNANTVKACWQSCEVFVLCGCIAVGLLQFISLHFGPEVWLKHSLYLRTQSRELPSEKTVKQVLSALLLRQFFQVGQKTISEEIREYLLKISGDIDDD